MFYHKKITNKYVRRALKALIVVAAVISVVFLYKLCLPNMVFFWGNEAKLELHTRYNVSGTLSEADSNSIKNMFVGKWNWFDSPDCGFDESNYITFGNTKFILGMDGCGKIQTGNRYFTLSEDDFNELNRILKKYNAEFPLF